MRQATTITDAATDRTVFIRSISARTKTTTPTTASSDAGTRSHLKIVRRSPDADRWTVLDQCYDNIDHQSAQ
jgi:hypothetical protein